MSNGPPHTARMPAAKAATYQRIVEGQRPLTPSPRALTLAGMQLTQDEITRLSPGERLRLIEQLWESLSDADIPLTPAQQAEVERRLATFEHDRAQAVTWDSLKAELARRCP